MIVCAFYLRLAFGSAPSQTGIINDQLEYPFLQSHRASNSFCEVRICGYLAKLAS